MKNPPAADLLVRGGKIVTPDGIVEGDLAVRHGQILTIAPSLDLAAATILDAAGCLVLPGFIDAHVHFNEPGRADWEGFRTGTSALAAGGGTAFIDMPLNSSPPVLDAASFAAKAIALEKHAVLDGALWGGLVPGNLQELPVLADCGVVGFKAFMSNSGIADFSRADATTLREGMARSADLQLPVAVHAEDDELTARLAAAAQARGETSIRAYLDSRPIEAELSAIGLALDLARSTGCALHVVHVSSAAGLKLIADARRAGLDVTAETCPHYLLLDEDDVLRLGAVAKCAPPLRSAAEREELWSALARGELDTIGSDHSPAPPDLKTDANFFRVWGGISGCQHAFPLFVEEALRRQLDPVQVSKWTSGHVARRFGLRGKGELRVDYDADLVLLREEPGRSIPLDELLYRHPQSPYLGRTTAWNVVATVVQGHIIYQHKKVGEPLRPARILRRKTR